MPVTLGPFVIQRPLARGGMAQVYKAQHTTQGVPVAVKVMTVLPQREAAFRAAFRTEVRAVAALAHPSIVPIFDMGDVDEEAEVASQGVLRAGSPYLVMELAPHGSLSRRRGRLRWTALRATLLGCLDALAHAHAHGLVHRDLKPGNLLLYDGDQVKLTDFGLAHLGDDDTSSGGTPTYMAPEQFTHHWRDFGPWTDLYGLGCLAWVLATGVPPFGDSSDVQATMRAHLTQEPGPFRPRVAVPEGLEHWLRRLLAKDPLQRFQRAADATWALMQLDTTLSGHTLPPLDELSEELSLPTQDTILREPALPNQDTMLREGSPPQPGTSSWPVLFSSWGSDDAPASPEGCAPPLPELATIPVPPVRPWLEGVGPRLYGLRQIPLVGRAAARETLWTALQEVHHEGGARVVMLSGPAGCGKTQLARWLAETADELGGAIVLRVAHTAGTGPIEGVRGLLLRTLRCSGLSSTGVRKRLRSRVALADQERDALAQLLTGEAGEDGPIPARECDAAVLRWLDLRARERPLLLWIDDAQFAAETLELLRRVLESQAYRPLPVLAVVLSQDEALADRPEETAALEALARLPIARSVRVLPFPEEERSALIRELLPLEPELSARLEARTAGHPRYAVQLLGDWVQRGLLEPGPRGWRLVKGASPELPEDLRQMETDRIGALLADRPESWRMALEIAAVLGTEIDGQQWLGACAVAGLEGPLELVEELASARLATVDPEGAGRAWAFTHGLVVDVVRHQAREAGRLVAAHRACAEMLADAEDPRRIGQRAVHLAAAGDLESADIDFHLAVTRGHDQDYRWTVDLVLAWDEALPVATPRALGPDEGRRRCEGWTRGARAARLSGRSTPAVRWLEAAEGVLQSHGWPDLRAIVTHQRAGLTADLGHTEEARERFAVAVSAATEAGDDALRLSGLLSTALLVQDLGNLPRARAHLEEVIRDARATGHDAIAARALISLGAVQLLEGRVPEAVASMEEALPALETGASRWDRAQAHNQIAEAWRAAGDLARAEEHYHRSLAYHRDLGSWPGVIAELNLALVGFARGRFAQAEPELSRILVFAQQDRRPTVEAAARVCLLRCAAELGRWEAMDEHLAQLKARLAETRLVYLDIAEQALQAGQVAHAEGRTWRARAALELALSQFVALGRDADRDRVGELLESMTRRRD